MRRSLSIFRQLKEKHLFLLLLVVNLLPLVFIKYFPSMDSPSQLYNSLLIDELLTNPGTEIESYFTFNTRIINWLHHIILFLFRLVVPSFIAEKLLVALYVVGLPLTYRNFIAFFKPANKYLSYLIFPFSYTFLFILGFYNFSLSLVILLLILKYYYRNRFNFIAKNYLILFGLFTLLYFSHLFVFLNLLIILATDFVWQLIYSYKTSGTGTIDRKQLLNHFLLLITSCSFGLYKVIEFTFFRMEGAGNGTNEWLPVSELIEWLFKVKPVISYYYSFEAPFGIAYAFVLLTLILSIFLLRFKKRGQGKKAVVKQEDGLFLSIIILLILYFSVPNFVAGIGGHMSARISTIMFILLLLWIALHEVSVKIQLFTTVVCIAVSVLLINKYVYVLMELDEDAVMIEEVSSAIEPYSVILPVNLSENWHAPHLSNYLGVSKPLVILENYEAGSGSFPLLWNYEEMPELTLGDTQKPACIKDWPSGNKGKKKIDYIFIWGRETDKSCLQELRELEGYKTVQENEKYLLLQTK